MNIKKMILITITVLFIVFSTFPAMADEAAPADGKAIFEKVAAALGGMENISKIKNLSYNMEFLRYLEDGSGTAPMHGESVIQYPDKFWYWSSVITPDIDFESIATIDGSKGWYHMRTTEKPSAPYEDMPDLDRTAQLKNILRDPLYITQNLDKYAFKNNGEKDFAGKKAIELHITGLYDFLFYVDPATYLPAGLIYKDISPADKEPVENVEIYSDFKTVDNVKFAAKQECKVKGKTWAVVNLVVIKTNVELDENFFKGK